MVGRLRLHDWDRGCTLKLAALEAFPVNLVPVHQRVS